MTAKLENFAKAGFLFATCRQSALANGPHGRTQNSGRNGTTNRCVENSIQVSQQAGVIVMRLRTLPDECIRPSALGVFDVNELPGEVIQSLGSPGVAMTKWRVK